MERTVLITREINCSNLSKEDFVKFMGEDLNAAPQKYYDVFFNKEKKYHDDFVAKWRDSCERNARQIAEKKWKRAANQEKYVNAKLEEFEKTTLPFRFNTITYFDLKLNPRENGIAGVCILNCDKVNKNAIGECYDYIKNNKYFKTASGWKLVDYHHSRPHIELILPEDMQKMYEREEKELEEDIRRFYANTTYFGD